ncbi:DNA-directed RNA polymerase I subunit RPA49 [Candida albicans P76067]|nr:DNA-directed RNA polymerase I subunit RPA49 [Candida albicans P76067]
MSSSIKVNSVTEKPVATVGSFFNGLRVSPEVEFDLYKHKKRDDYVLHGETDTLDYNGTSNNENEYVVAVFDPNSKSVELYKTPYISTKVTAKKNRVYKGPKVKSAGIRNVTQRNALGEAFGTKKAKSAITNLEKNRIDSEKLQDIEMDIVDTVKESTRDLPAQEDGVDRPAPLANVDATNVEDIYPLENIIPEKDWQYLRVSSILTAENPLEKLPFTKSKFIAKQLPILISQKNTEKLQMLFYASLLLGVYENRRVKDKQSLMTRLQNIPSEILVDGILDRFAISRATKFGKSKDKSFTIDPYHEDKLLTYLFILLLHINNFTVELVPLSKDLKLKNTRLVGLFRALGAIIKSATVGEAEALGIPKSAVGTYKIATLKVPFKLPELTRRGKRR